MAAPIGAPTRQITLSDIYADRDLTDAQCRRLVALLGLAHPQRADDSDDEAA